MIHELKNRSSSYTVQIIKGDYIMASVIDYPICEKCGRECINEFNCRVFEEFQTCQVCGANGIMKKKNL